MTFYKKLGSLPLGVGLVFRCLRKMLLILFRFYSRTKLHNRLVWSRRTKDVLRCPDNKFIPRVEDAGIVIDDYQIMHNGIRIVKNSYCGDEMRQLLFKNRGVHEPQEERLFQEILKYLPDDAVMIELGSYWAFYSMWFYKVVKHPTCYLVEADPLLLEYGLANFRLNKMQGEFSHFLIGKTAGITENGIPIISIDDFITKNQIPHVHILHSDIQGAEIEMLLGAEQALKQNRIDFIFISTHSHKLHEQVLQVIRRFDFYVLAEADMMNTYSYDGLIVAVRNGVNAPISISISQNK